MAPATWEKVNGTSKLKKDQLSFIRSLINYICNAHLNIAATPYTAVVYDNKLSDNQFSMNVPNDQHKVNVT